MSTARAADGQWHSFGATHSAVGSQATNGRTAASASFGHSGAVVSANSAWHGAGWHGGYYGGYGGYWGRGGYGWGGGCWGCGWNWGWGLAWSPFWYWPSYWYSPLWWGSDYPPPSYIYSYPY
ncbi:MAG: hypothetical protein WA830_24155 [Candidatus Sulfotelmatobacter sp.]